MDMRNGYLISNASNQIGLADMPQKLVSWISARRILDYPKKDKEEDSYVWDNNTQLYIHHMLPLQAVGNTRNVGAWYFSLCISFKCSNKHTYIHIYIYIYNYLWIPKLIISIFYCLDNYTIIIYKKFTQMIVQSITVHVYENHVRLHHTKISCNSFRNMYNIHFMEF